MDDYTPMYCAGCAQLRWREYVKGDCEFCGGAIFAPVRPAPTFSTIDRRVLHALDIPVSDFVNRPREKKR